jgi:hypothetical protein
VVSTGKGEKDLVIMLVINFYIMLYFVRGDKLQNPAKMGSWINIYLNYKEDNYEQFLKPWVYERVGHTANIKIVETRGGYHVLVDPSTVEESFKKNWYQELAKQPHTDQTGDQLIPIPGCVQGDFMPRFV